MDKTGKLLKYQYIHYSRIAAIIQARMNSSRFPQKVVADICGKTMLERVVDRIRASGINAIIIAVPDTPLDRRLLDVAARCKTRVYTGSEANVLSRYWEAATSYSCVNTIIRVTADCPLIDPEVINKTLEFFTVNKLDYAANTKFYPDGMDTEVFTYGALYKAYENAKTVYDREHVTPYIFNHPQMFKVGYLESEKEYPKIHWSVDRPEDLDFVRAVYQELGPLFTLDEIIKFREENEKV